jgi:hypothetical protein
MALVSSLILRRAIWNADLRRSILNKSLADSARNLEANLKNNIDNSTPAGRYYSRGRVTAKRTAANSNLRRAPGTKTRVIISSPVFRASAPGQPPARRFNVLYNSLKVRRVPGKLQILASVNAPGVEVLDDPKRLNRPFFKTVIVDYRRNEFVDNVKQGVRKLLE